MRFYSRTLVKKVRTLKKKGFSAAKIGKQLGIGDTTVLRWCFDIPSVNPYHIKIQELQNKIKERGYKLIKNFKINQENAKIVASILYWCEGYRYPSCNFIGFSNGDVNLVRTF
jgi:transcriptional regulator with XRE-family HTH domain